MNSAIILIVLLGVFSIVMTIWALLDTKRKNIKNTSSFNSEVLNTVTLSREEFKSDMESHLDKLHSCEYKRINITQDKKEESEVVVITIDKYEELCKRYKEDKNLQEPKEENNIFNSLKDIHKKLDALQDNVLIIRDLK